MSELPVRTRKRDKLGVWFNSGRSAPPIVQQISNAGASNTPPGDALALSSSSSNPPAPVSSSTSSASTASTTLIKSIPLLPSTPTPLARGLWLDALQKLSEVDQQAIRSIQLTQDSQRPLTERIEDLVSLTRQKQLECEKESYKFRFQGKEIILRDVAGKIIFWLNKFKDVGDVAVSFDPVHASLPWAGVRFLLQAAVAGHEQMGALLVSIEKVTYLTNRCAIYESLYKSGTTPEQVLHNFHSALIELYAAILQSMALTNRLFAKNIASQAMHALINPGKVPDLLAKFQGLEARVEIEAQNCERVRTQKADARAQELLESLRAPTLRTDERVLSLLEKVDENELLKILDWISKVLYGMNHDNVKDQRTKDTCEWLIRNNNYLEWQDTSSSMILWLHGTAGTGKTYLTSRVIDEIRGTLKSNPNHEGLAFFYCNRNETERQEPLSVLRSFVRQLSTIIKDENSIQRRLRQYCIQTRLKASEPSISDCKELLLELINLYPKTTLILDALDECDKDKRVVLFDIFNYFLARASRPVKIFISSRPDWDIRERFRSQANIEIQATDNHNDISMFVQSEIAKHSRWNKISPELQKEVVETLQKRSQGMFQWAYLQIKQLSVLKEGKQIRDRLGALPKDLKDAYDEIHNGMNERERQIADRAFQWVMCSHQPLKTSALLLAVCQDEEDDTVKLVDDLDEDLLLQYCHNLLVIDAERGVWVPSHLSVIEYFENHLWSQTQANCLVSSVCLLLLNDTTHYDRVKKGPFSRMRDHSVYDKGFDSLSFYARHHWMIHVQQCEEEGNKDRLSNLLKRFLGSPTDSSPAYQNWHRILAEGIQKSPRSSIFKWNGCFRLEDLKPASSATFAICAFGFYTILSDWWDNPWMECVPKNEEGGSLLQLAVIAESVSICGRLIDWGAEVNEQLQHYRHGSALAAAADGGNKEVVELLIKSGADVNAQFQAGYYGSALAVAAYRGNKEVVELLIKSGADVNAQLQVGYYGSALAVAADGGNKEVVELLITSGADVNAQLQVGHYGSALAVAADRGNKEVVELLIKSGADVNAQLQVGFYGSALATVAYRGNLEVVELLIKSGADVNAQLQAGYYGSALAVAAYGGEKEVVELLIKSGADVNAQLQAGHYGSALAAVAYRGNLEVVELLIKSGADVNVQLQAGYFGSALAAAAAMGRKEVVELLIKSGADVNAKLQAGRYGSALAAVAYMGKKEMVELLIKSGADVNAQLQAGLFGSALEATAMSPSHSKEMVELLIKSGAEMSAEFQTRWYGAHYNTE